MKDFNFETQCRECCGLGTVESGPTCHAPASSCCGGCYETIECDNCSGHGKIYATFSAEELNDIIEFHFDGDLMLAHELIMDKL